MYILYQKLKDLRKELIGLNREAYMDITSRVNTARVKLEQVQTTLQQDPFNTILQNEERDLYSQLKTLSANEEEVLRQKSRVTWVQLGDGNTRYFHSICRERKAKNAITQITSSSGDIITDPATIKEEILKHYQEFLGSSPSTRTHTDYSFFDSKTLDDDDRLHLEADISEGETTDAMFSINTDKAAGPDGFNSLFYRHSWEIVKEDVINAIMEFFAKGKMLKQVNSTAITLIPSLPL